jgi:hypothetical protein
MSIPDRLTIDREDLILIAACIGSRRDTMICGALIRILTKNDLTVEDIKEGKWNDT